MEGVQKNNDKTWRNYHLPKEDLAYDVNNKVLSRDSNYIVNVAMWTNFGNSNISMEEVIITSIL